MLILRPSAVESSCSRFHAIPVSSGEDATIFPVGEREDWPLDWAGVTKRHDRVELYVSKSSRIEGVVEVVNTPGSRFGENERDTVVVLVPRAVKEVVGPAESLG